MPVRSNEYNKNRKSDGLGPITVYSLPYHSVLTIAPSCVPSRPFHPPERLSPSQVPSGIARIAPSMTSPPSFSFSKPAMPGDALSVLVLVEDSAAMAAKWPDVRDSYLPKLLENLRSADPFVQVCLALRAILPFSPSPGEFRWMRGGSQRPQHLLRRHRWPSWMPPKPGCAATCHSGRVAPPSSRQQSSPMP